MSMHHPSGLLQAVLFLASCFGFAQSPSPQPQVYQSNTTVKSTTRLVVVDVVATDSGGRPVTGLGVDDFTVLENGAQQKISNFSFQNGSGVQPVTRAPLPPNVVTNAPSFQSGVLDVILFDSVNGDFKNQAYARDQLIRFFSKTTLNRPVALFALESQLKLLHDFTTDTGALKSAIEKYKQVAMAQTTESLESRSTPFTTQGDYHTGERNIETTLNQLNALSKILSGYPGRKNLIWLSESFPLDLYPDTVMSSGVNISDISAGPGGSPQRSDPNAFSTMVSGAAMKNFSSLVKKVADSMMNAQVAIYPVDAAGVSKDEHLAALHTANDMAERTGGRAFHNRNDLEQSIQASITDGDTYYTLSYYPENKKWDGQFRAIQIKSARPGLTLRHRVGYYAIDPEEALKEDANRVSEDFSRALLFDSPAVTAVRFQAGVVPPSPDTKGKLLVNFAVDPHTLHFNRGEDGVQHGRITCVVWAYGKNKDKPVMSQGATSSADLKPEVFEDAMKKLFPCTQELALKPGTYTLRLGVLDRNSNLMGTATTPVAVR